MTTNVGPQVSVLSLLAACVACVHGDVVLAILTEKNGE